MDVRQVKNFNHGISFSELICISWAWLTLRIQLILLLFPIFALTFCQKSITESREFPRLPLQEFGKLALQELSDFQDQEFEEFLLLELPDFQD